MNVTITVFCYVKMYTVDLNTMGETAAVIFGVVVPLSRLRHQVALEQFYPYFRLDGVTYHKDAQC